MVKFKVKIDTLSMYHDNRQFKIVFSVFDAPKHINSCTTMPFRLVYVVFEIDRNLRNFRKKFPFFSCKIFIEPLAICFLFSILNLLFLIY